MLPAMPRKGRLHIAGGFYHVMGRGLERRRIFQDKADKQDFLRRLSSGLEETGSHCMAWAVMPNHYHLLIQSGATPLSRLMQKVLSGYATTYNLRHRRSGYVFQYRYKSILCDEAEYFLELVRYIHLNPVKAKLIRTFVELEGYPWTGHAVILGRHQHTWQDTKAVLDYFGGQIIAARRHYCDFISAGLNKPDADDFSGGGLIRSYGGWQSVMEKRREHEARIGDERILGESAFVERVLKEDEIAIEKRTQLQQSGWDLEVLIDYICEQHQVQKALITTRGRENQLSIARGLICYFGMHHLGLSTTAIAGRLNKSQPAASKAFKRGLAYCRENQIKFIGD
jgi:REP element-mobilizing transposase RayT